MLYSSTLRVMSFMSGVVLFYFFIFFVFYIDCNYLIEIELSSVSSFSFDYVMIFDWKSCLFGGVVCLISSMIMFFSCYYMIGDMNFKYFFWMMMCFVGSMLLVVFSCSFIGLILGWDGLGLTSYLLVSYYNNSFSGNSGMITIMMNRFGDINLLLSIALLGEMGGWSMVSGVFVDNVFIILSLFIVSMTKSAQFPFMVWLPAAMSAPTPVSALVHSSTLVTAGVYLMIRFYGLISEYYMVIILCVGLLTMIMSGFFALFEVDMKKVVALSTLSQLGLMMISLGLGCVDICYFHLLSHALFKSMLFIGVGVIIHNNGGYQDFRMKGVEFMSNSFLSVLFMISNLALIGFPFLSGFYSKDMVSEFFFVDSGNMVLLILFLLGVGLTVGYSFRLIWKISGCGGMSSVLCGGGACSLEVIMSVFFLMVFTIYFGYLFSEMMMWNYKIMVLSSIGKYMVLMIMVFAICLKLFSTLENKSCKYLMVVKNYMFCLKVLSSWDTVTLLMKSGGFGVGFSYTWMEFYGGKGVMAVFMRFMGVLQLVQLSGIIFFSLFIMFIFLFFC